MFAARVECNLASGGKAMWEICEVVIMEKWGGGELHRVAKMRERKKPRKNDYRGKGFTGNCNRIDKSKFKNALFCYDLC